MEALMFFIFFCLRTKQTESIYTSDLSVKYPLQCTVWIELCSYLWMKQFLFQTWSKYVLKNKESGSEITVESLRPPQLIADWNLSMKSPHKWWFSVQSAIFLPMIFPSYLHPYPAMSINYQRYLLLSHFSCVRLCETP